MEEKKKKKRRFRRPKKIELEGIKNPFINPTFQIPVTKVKINEGLFRFVGDRQVSAEEEVRREQQKYIKIYTDIRIDEEDEEGNLIVEDRNNYKSSLRKDRSSLSPKAIHLLFWIAEEMRTGQDYVILNKERYMKEGGIGSINTVKAAIKELVDKVFISPASIRDMYFINPMYMFKGSRVKKYPKNLVNYDELIKE